MRKLLTLFLLFPLICFSQDGTVQYQEQANRMYQLGNQDANRYYKKYKASTTGTLVAGIAVTPVLGLVPAENY